MPVLKRAGVYLALGAALTDSRFTRDARPVRRQLVEQEPDKVRGHMADDEGPEIAESEEHEGGRHAECIAGENAGKPALPVHQRKQHLIPCIHRGCREMLGHD